MAEVYSSLKDSAVIPAKAGIHFLTGVTKPDKMKMDYSPHPRLALRAIGFADVRYGILPSQSGFRFPIVPGSGPGMTSK